jgi:enoyl-CoA hydratase/carnithine racemase
MPDASASYETLLYTAADGIATITLNRPDALNTIVPPMPDEVEAAVAVAIRDPEVRVIVLRGAGRAFCAGYDFGGGFHHWDEWITTDGSWDPGKDFVFATHRRSRRRRSSCASGARRSRSSRRSTAGASAAAATSRCARTSSWRARTP